MEHPKRYTYDNPSMKALFILVVGITLGYLLSLVNEPFNQFMFTNFIKFCRWAELPHEVWAFMDQYIFSGAL